MAEFNLVIAFKGLFDEITGLGALRTEQEVVKVRAELFREVVAAQQAVMNLQEENAALRDRLSEAEQRIAEAEQRGEAADCLLEYYLKHRHQDRTAIAAGGQDGLKERSK